MGYRIDNIKRLVKSPKGKNILSFLLFLAIASVLWIVMTLNEEAQRDLRCAVKISNVPDSVVRVSPIPKFLNVSVRSRGTSMIKYLFSDDLKMNIDYRNYVSGNHFILNEAALRAFFRSRLGGDVQVLSVNPDSLSIFFTANKGVKVPVKVDAHVVPGPQFAIIGKIRSLTDSVTLYSVDAKAAKTKSVTTAPIVLNDVRSSQTIRVPVIVGSNMRAIPDSVDVHIDVEPLISKTRMVEITPVNVPEGVRLIAVPNRVEVYYMVPMSIYKKAESNPKFTVKADYNTISPGSDKVAVALTSAPENFLNVFLEVDSVEYILEQ